MQLWAIDGSQKKAERLEALKKELLSVANGKTDGFSWHYGNEYVLSFIRENYVWDEKLKRYNKLSDKQMLSEVDWDAERRQLAIEEDERERERKKLKLSRAKSKPLTPAERYICHRAGIFIERKYVRDQGTIKRENLKTPAECRQAMKGFHKRKDYQLLSNLDAKLRTYRGEINLATFSSSGDGETDFLNYEERRKMLGWFNELYAFVVAEHDVEGLTDEQIEALFVLEGI